MTAVAPWGENAEDAFDQGLVELGLGDVRLIQAQGAMLPLGFESAPPRPLPMGSLVECHLATAYSWNGSSASAGVAWASCVTPEGDECAIVATISTDRDYEETVLLLRRNLQRRLASRDLEVLQFDVAVDEGCFPRTMEPNNAEPADVPQDVISKFNAPFFLERLRGALEPTYSLTMLHRIQHDFSLNYAL